MTSEKSPIAIESATIGTITDLGITDAANMGAAMAPAAADTLATYFHETGTTPADYDAIFTGDLGAVGSLFLYRLLARAGYDLGDRHRDCGMLLYDARVQDVHSGASGCGCSASVLAAHILPSMERGAITNALFLSTGALMSPTSIQQGESIFGIAPLVHLRRRDGR